MTDDPLTESVADCEWCRETDIPLSDVVAEGVTLATGRRVAVSLCPSCATGGDDAQ